MLQRLIQFFKRLFQRLFGKQQPPPPPMPTPPSRSDTDYEVLFMALLEKVQQGASRGNLKGWFITQKLEEAALVAWLERFGERLINSLGSDNTENATASHEELARRMVQLASLDVGELGNVAGRIGRSILEQVAPEEADQAELYPVIDADFRGDGFTVPVEEMKPEVTSSEQEAEAWVLRGVELYDDSDFAGALSCFDEAIKLQPDSGMICIHQGDALYKLGKLEEAIASYDKAIELQPDASAPWNGRGNALKDLGKLEEAIASYNKAIELQPDDSTA